MENNYNRICASIGQALSYFKYGVDRSYLIIGISNNIEPVDVDMGIWIYCMKS